jgi:hypothetical protein
MIKIKSRSLSARNQGPERKKIGRGLILRNLRGFLTKFPSERLSSALGHPIIDQWTR